MKKLLALLVLSSIFLISCESKDLQGKFSSKKPPTKMEAESTDEVVSKPTSQMEAESTDE